MSTDAIVHRLYDRLPANGSELVLFDINRESTLAPFLKLPEEALVRDLQARTDLKYRLTVVTNARRDTRDVVARSWGPGPPRSEETALGLAWPADVFSLSHVAIPFPESDDLYGRLAEPPPTFGLRLGRVGPRGERAVLTVPFDQWMRLTWNPFYPWIERARRRGPLFLLQRADEPGHEVLARGREVHRERELAVGLAREHHPRLRAGLGVQQFAGHETRAFRRDFDVEHGADAGREEVRSRRNAASRGRR